MRALLRRGKRSRTAHLDVFASTSPAAYPRAGVIVPRHGQRIVDRNLLRRRLREIVRVDVLPGLAGGVGALDVLVRARREAYRAEYGELRSELLEWLGGQCSRAP